LQKRETDFRRFEAAISREHLPDRVPNGEIEVDFEIMEAYLGRPIADLATYVSFWAEAGYDYAILQVRGQWLSDSFQIKILEGVLAGEVGSTASTYSGGVNDEASFEKYPWIGPEGVYYGDMDRIGTELREGMKLLVNVGPIFSGTWRCMGLEAFSIACVESPELVGRVAEKMGGLTVKIAEDVVQREEVAGIWLGDDIAFTTGLMVAPSFLREQIFPYYRAIGEVCRRHGKLFIYHSDGRIEEVMEDLIACGIQAVHPNEPTSVDIAEVKATWGDRLALVGNMDVDLLTRGTPGEVTASARELIERVGPGGGFALGSGNSVTKHMPLANYRAMLEAVERFGGIY